LKVQTLFNHDNPRYVIFTLLTGGTFFYSNWNISQEYLIQNFLKLEGTNYNFKWVKVSGIASYLKKADFDPGLAINKYDQS
jgi:hypothetical protein